MPIAEAGHLEDPAEAISSYYCASPEILSPPGPPPSSPSWPRPQSSAGASPPPGSSSAAPCSAGRCRCSVKLGGVGLQPLTVLKRLFNRPDQRKQGHAIHIQPRSPACIVNYAFTVALDDPLPVVLGVKEIPAFGYIRSIEESQINEHHRHSQRGQLPRPRKPVG